MTAIKKIVVRSRSAVAEVFKEAGLLAKLSHPSVIHYYNIWKETVPTSSLDDKTSSDDSGDDISLHDDDPFEISPDNNTPSTSGPLDFISNRSQPYLEIKFEGDDGSDVGREVDESEDEDHEDADQSGSEHNSKNEDDDGLMSVPRERYVHRPYTTVIYISMEYCENHVS